LSPWLETGYHPIVRTLDRRDRDVDVRADGLFGDDRLLSSTAMKPEAIFAPVSALAIWTASVVFWTGFVRIRAVRQGRAPRGAFRLGEAPGVPTDVTVVNRNLMNLLEMPVLFYVVCIAFYVTRHVDPGLITLAWIFVAFRLVHSLIHLTTNRVLQRLTAFALSNVVLVMMWIRFIRRVL
jgi:hypothetical protein